jgi:hypothetical protein
MSIVPPSAQGATIEVEQYSSVEKIVGMESKFGMKTIGGI